MTRRLKLDDAELRRRYDAGESLRGIAGDLGIAVGTVRDRLPAARSTGRPPRGDVDTAEIIRLREEEGLTWAAIGARVGMNKSTVLRRYETASRA